VQSTLPKADIVISNEYRKSEDQRLPETESQLKFANVNINIEWPKGSTVEAVGNFSQIDYYCHPQGNDLMPETIWRLRIENNGLLSITYKGADQLHSVVRSKSKIEVYKLDELFQNHFFKFYRKTLIVFKHRLTYKLDGVCISFDRVSVEDSGSMNFVELSGQPAAIEVVANKLKLDLNQAIKESYFELFTKGQNK
jgi:adenylate cyclase class IV